MEYIFPSIGVGTMLWTPKNEDEKERYFQTFQYCLDRGVNFFDTAEVYGNGSVEKLLGEFIKRDGRPVKICTTEEWYYCRLYESDDKRTGAGKN